MSFNEPIVDGALDAGNWSFSPSGLETITGVSAVGGVVQITLDSAPISVTGVSFAPPPFDVVGQTSGGDAEAFTDYPVTTT